MPFVTEELWQRLPKTPEQVSQVCVHVAWHSNGGNGNAGSTAA
jgi:valyl-tRNA synthetase